MNGRDTYAETRLTFLGVVKGFVSSAVGWSKCRVKRAFDRYNVFKDIHVKMSTDVPRWEIRTRFC
jgi:hypothetical protein